MLRGGLGQAEGTPVRVAADYAARSENLNTGITGNSGISLVSPVRFPSILDLQPARGKDQRRWMEGNVLSDLMEAARTDLRCISINQAKTKDKPRALTIAISSYNIAASGLRGCRTRLHSSSRRRNEFLRVSSLEVGGLIRRAWRCLSVGKLFAEAIGITTSCTSYLPTTLSSSSFSSSLLELFSLPSQLYIPPAKMSAIARCVRPFASRALSQKLPITRVSPAMSFPRGSIRSFSQSAFCTIVPNLPIGMLFWLDTMLTDSSGSKEVH